MQSKSQAPSITTGPITAQLLLFFFPILLGTFFQQLYNTVDTIIVGNFVGTNTALAAVGGATGQLVNLFVGFFIGLSSGCSTTGRETKMPFRRVYTRLWPFRCSPVL